MTQTKPLVEIVNVVASASINQRLDLNEIAKKFPHAEYNPEQFPGLVFRIKNPRSATLIFSSGKFVCTGSKSEQSAIDAINAVVKELRRVKIKIKNEPEITIQNIVASANLGAAVHLQLAARSLPRSMYEPEQFPGVIHRMLDPKAVTLIFVSGKLVCVGTRKESEVYRAVHNLHTLLEEKKLMRYQDKAIEIIKQR